MDDDPRLTGLCAVCRRSCYLDDDGNMPWRLPTISLRATHRKGCPCRGAGLPPVTEGRCMVCSRIFGLTWDGRIPEHSKSGSPTRPSILAGSHCEGGSRAPRGRNLPLDDCTADFEIRITALVQPGTGRRR
jgi:hypothetical protein